MIYARPNMNGNSRQHFLAAATSLNKAANAAERAMHDLQMDVFHGRNYQTVPEVDQERARVNDDKLVAEAYQSIQNLKDLYEQVLRRAHDKEYA